MNFSSKDVAAPQAAQAIPSCKMTQDFIVRDGLAAYCKLRPYLAEDGSIHLYCLSGTWQEGGSPPFGSGGPMIGTPVHLSMDSGGVGAWQQEVVSQTAVQDLFTLATADACSLLLIPPLYSAPVGQYFNMPPALGIQLLADGSLASNSWDWPRNWNATDSMFMPGASPMSNLVLGMAPLNAGAWVCDGHPFLVIPNPENANLLTGVDFALPDSNDTGASGSPIASLPSTTGLANLLALDANNPRCIFQWVGDPMGYMTPGLGLPPISNPLTHSPQQPPLLPPNAGAISSVSVAVSDAARQQQPGGFIVMTALTAVAGWYTLVGTIDPKQVGLVTWANSWLYVCPTDNAGNPIQFDQISSSISVNDGGYCSVFLRDAARQLNISQLNLNAFGQWSAPMVLSTDVDEFATFTDKNGCAAYFAVVPGGLELATRDHTTTDWVHGQVNLPDSAATTTQALNVYRAGLTLLDANNVGLVQANFSVEASENVMATIGGRRYLLGPGQTVNATTDGTGSIWIAIDMNPTILAAPRLTIRSTDPGSTFQQVIAPDAGVATYLSTVTAQNLLDASDGTTPVLPPAYQTQSDAEAIAQALNSVNALTAAAYQGAGVSDPSLVLRPGIGAWSEQSTPVGQSTALAPLSGSFATWSFSAANGQAVFHLLDPTEQEAFSKLAVAQSSDEVLSLLGIDWGDVWNSVVDGATEVANVTVAAGNQVTASVTFIIEGVETIVTTVLTSTSEAFDLVTGIFAQLGTKLGTVTGWLMKQIGYLFGWGDILSRRNAMLALIRGLPGSLTAKYPSTSADAFTSQAMTFLLSLETNFATVTSSVGGPPFSSQMGTWPSIADALGDALSPISWLVDKLEGFANDVGVLTPIVANNPISSALTTFALALTPDALTNSISSSLAGAPGNWMQSSANLAAGQPSDLIAGLAPGIVPVIQTLQSSQTEFQALAEAIWSEPGLSSMLDFIDQPVDIPFLSGFYNGLTEHDLSMLDVVCLFGAIIDKATPSDTALSDSERYIQALLWVGIGTRALSAATLASGKPNKGTIHFLQLLDSALAAAVSLLLVEVADSTDTAWFAAGLIYCMQSFATLAATACDADQVAVTTTTFCATISLITSIYMFSTEQAVEPTLFNLFDSIALFMSACASWKAETGQPPPPIAYTVLQTGLATGSAVTWKLRAAGQTAGLAQSPEPARLRA